MLIKETKEMSEAEARACRNTNAAYLRSIALPVGAILDFAGDTVPNGALLCDGSAISRTVYSELFAVIGTTFGEGDGESTFNLPDMRGKMSVGTKTGDSDLSEVGKTGGEKTHTLTADEMPANIGTFRTLSWSADKTCTGKFSGTDYAVSDLAQPAAGNLWGTSEYKLSGGGQAHNNMPPFLVINKIIVAFGGTLMDENGVLKPIWEPDDTYNPESVNPQSGKAVAEALESTKNDIVTGENQEKSNALKGKKSGIAPQISDISPVEHTLRVNLESEEDMDFSGVKVIRYGKNLLNVPENFTWSGVYTVKVYIPAGTYHITYSGETHEGAETPILRIGNKSYSTERKDWTVVITSSQSVVYLYTNGYNAAASKDVSATINQWMISVDGGDYEPYKVPTEYMSNVDGTVEGIKSIYPTTTLVTDSETVTVNAEYNRDINKAFAELQQLIVSLAGNV